MKTLARFQGVDADCIEKLQAAGISSLSVLLANCIRAKARVLLAKRTGIPRTTILEWVHQADLLRIDGVEPEYANLLRAAGVETVSDLSRRNAAKLRKRMMETQEVKSEACPLPSEAEIMDWIEQAQGLPRIIQ